jgi:oxygen-independent coproporphyrinogen-3 oxidase
MMYTGIGPSAHSYDGRKRCWNITNNNMYIERIGAGIIPEEYEVLDARTRYNEYIMTGLRTMWGVSTTFMDELLDGSTVHFLQHVDAWIHSGHLVKKGDMWVCSEKGFFLVDRIVSDAMMVG